MQNILKPCALSCRTLATIGPIAPMARPQNRPMP
jgi:hypothetical protein